MRTLGWLFLVACSSRSGHTTGDAGADAPKPPDPPPPGIANLFVVPTGGSAACTRLPVAVAFSASTAASWCDSFDHAYHAAESGDVVEVQAGEYAPQGLTPDAGKGPAYVTFQAAVSATVTLGCDDPGVNCLTTGGASHLMFIGFHTQMFTVAGMPSQGAIGCDRGSSDIVFRDLDVGGAFMACDDDSMILGGDYGPSVDENLQITSATNGPTDHVLIEGATIHDFALDQRHNECIALWSGKNITIRGNQFDNCVVYSIAQQVEAGDTNENILIENNIFRNTKGVSASAAVQISSHGGSCINQIVRNNTFFSDGVLDDCADHGTSQGVVVVGNAIAGGRGCSTNERTDYNAILSGEPCGPHDQLVASFGLTADGHLMPGSPLIDRADPTSFAATDLDGDLRPRGAAPDVGADEAP
jgi:hypothetical protein